MITSRSSRSAILRLGSASAALLTSLALGGCGPVDGPTYYSDAKPILDAYCVDCHTEGGVAPFPYDTAEQAAESAALIAWAVADRAMPPWDADSSVRPLRYDLALSDAHIATLTEWADAGAAMGDPADEATPIALEKGGLDRVDVDLTLPAPYTPDPARADDYRCFPIDWPETETSWISGFVGQPDYDPVVHHIVAFVVPPSAADLVHGYDDYSDGPGYPCFGAISPTDQITDDVINTSMLGQWAPGMEGIALPDNTGVRIEPGTVMVLQMHYTTVVETLAPDQSSLGMRVEHDAPERDAYLVPWMNYAWYANPDTMAIPAGESGVLHSHQAELVGSVQTQAGGAGGTLDQGAVVHSVFPHMHKIGRSFALTKVSADGAEELLLSIPSWDFDWQRDYAFAEPVVFEPGDQLRSECWWDNTAEWRAEQGVTPVEPIGVTWGEGTYDEMCVALLTVTPPE
ncbi:MAG: monooxygenase [Deltaproteobacteria bacterium]|nr:monooxygenase [Deltaproteobacteria bacterium]